MITRTIGWIDGPWYVQVLTAIFVIGLLVALGWVLMNEHTRTVGRDRKITDEKKRWH